MTLYDSKVGNTYIVKELKLDLAAERRLEALGLTNGTRVTVLNRKRQGALIFKVRGTRLAIGRKIAESILIEEEA